MSKTRLTVFAAVLCPWLFLFGRVLLSSDSFVFRDAAHYYYPLFQWSASEWGSGRIPLWNPQENLGSPVLADSTTSVFYPGKLVFALPLAYATQYKLYVSAHLLLAAAAAYLVARRWGGSVAAAGLAAVSYSFGGCVVFQYCNVVYLVGAAWLPLALWLADHMLRTRKWGNAVWFGVVLALQTLGGDPQMAYHAGLLAGLLAVLMWLADRRRSSDEMASARTENRRGDQPPPALPRWTRAFHAAGRSRIGLLLMAGATGALLAAVQVLPSSQWTWHSHRAAFQWPRSVYETPSFLRRGRHEPTRPESGRPTAPAHDRRARTQGVAQGLFGRPQPGSHHANAFEFSVGPWRWAEFLWPNVSGRQFPIHRRWIGGIPAEGRVWSPTLYMGLLPLLLGIGSLRLGVSHVRQCWLSWTVFLGIAGSLGVYGLGWLIDEFQFALWGDAAGQPWLGPQVGGLYWLMTLLLPGYVLFRYPAKLLIVASLALSLLGALGWDQACDAKATRMHRVLAGLGAVSLLAAVLLFAAQSPIKAWLHNVPADALFGPLDVDGAWRDLLTAFLHTALVSLLLGGLWIRTVRSDFAAWKCLTLTLCAVELTVAQAWLVPSASQAIWQQTPKMATAIGHDAERRHKTEPFRVFRARHARWRPEAWQFTSSPQRQIEGLKWDRATLFPRYHLQTDLAMVESTGAFIAGDLQWLLDTARQYGPLRPDGMSEPSRSVLDALAAHYFVLPDGFRLADTEIVDLPGHPPDTADANLVHNPQAFGRAWIVHDVLPLPELRTADPQSVRRRTEEVLFPGGRPRDLRRRAVVECDVDFQRPSIPQPVSSNIDVQQDVCRIVHDTPHRIQLDVQLTRPGLVILSDLFYPGWEAHVENHADRSKSAVWAPILRTNRVMRGVYLPAGSYLLEYRYRPGEFYAGAAISVISWLAVGLILVLSGYRARRQRRGNRDA